MAFAHNGNLSNGIMFPVDAQYTGRKLDKKYVEQRAKWERMYEITQIKGDGEAHPFLSPDDEFADYGTWDVGNLDLTEAKTDDMLAGEYAREALKSGLALEKKLGTNPYKFGIVGATDSHTSLPTAEEDNFFGKHTGYEPSPERLTHTFVKTENGEIFSWQQVASGYTAVWARENTRASLFDAMDRKEVYATTGPRMAVRFFGGWDFSDADLNNRQPAFAGYSKGVPMGGDLTAAPEGKAPTFMAIALRDPIGANLDRVQIIKGWLDAAGKTHEKVYDVAWSGDRKARREWKTAASGQHGRCGRGELDQHNWCSGTGEPSGPIQISILPKKRSTTSGFWRSPHRLGMSMMPSGSVLRSPRMLRSPNKNGPTRRLSGTRRTECPELGSNSPSGGWAPNGES